MIYGFLPYSVISQNVASVFQKEYSKTLSGWIKTKLRNDSCFHWASVIDMPRVLIYSCVKVWKKWERILSIYRFNRRLNKPLACRSDLSYIMSKLKALFLGRLFTLCCSYSICGYNLILLKIFLLHNAEK